MNRASAWRLEYGRYVGQAYMAEPVVVAVMVSGSTGRGHADRFSDVDMGVFWQRPPREEERQRIVARISADHKRLFPYDAAYQVWSEDYLVGRVAAEAEGSGQLVEVGSYTVETMDEMVAAVMHRFDPDEEKQNMIAGVRQAVVLKGEERIASWRAQTEPYPDALAAAVVKRYGQIDHFWRREMWVARNNPFALRKQIYDVQRSVLHMILAVNRVYYFKFKWLDQVLARCPLAPADFLPRFRRIAQDADLDAAERLRDLVEEVYDLVEVHVPGVDVDWLRRVFRWNRPAWGDEGPLVAPGELLK